MLLDGAGTGQPGSNYMTTLGWGNLAGKASQLPTRGLLHSGKSHAAAQAHHTAARRHAAAVDHVLATETVRVKIQRERK